MIKNLIIVGLVIGVLVLANLCLTYSKTVDRLTTQVEWLTTDKTNQQHMIEKLSRSCKH